MAGLVETTRTYEAWLKGEIEVVPADLVLKHKLMAGSAFPFMRATFYRWASLWHEVCGGLAEAPKLLAVGDLHVENFGTWRDAEGRLVWGINDVDEAAQMPYTIDLVRLATSALLARREEHFAINGKAACKAILKGYRKQITDGGRAFVLEEDYPFLRTIALAADRDPDRFWKKMTALPDVAAPPHVRRLLARHLPGVPRKFRIAHRIAGLGSLGRPRYVALYPWRGAQIAREAKAVVPSAFGWALGKPERRSHLRAIVERGVRCQDPYFAIVDDWLVRRLGPHCSRIELSMLPKERDERRLLEAMGRETANLHFGSAEAIASVRADLERRPNGWLLKAAGKMAEATIADWKTWRARR
jgi:uncharacterized protein (DUF2252 family)